MTQSSAPGLTLAIQAGGRSSRMGSDKALLPFRGQPLIGFVAARGRLLSADLLVTANDPRAYAFLGLPVFADRLAQPGALTGMHTALSAAASPLVAVIGCDMPFFSPELLRRAAELLADPRFAAAVPRGTAGLEPLHAVYRRAACLPALESALERGIRSLRGWLELLPVAEIPLAEVRALDPAGRAFVNLNTPAEYRAANAGQQE